MGKYQKGSLVGGLEKSGAESSLTSRCRENVLTNLISWRGYKRKERITLKGFDINLQS